ncbi:hypothetical protein ACCI51_18980 [Microbulbifer echini]|uniref:Uncharacterized protein n=1 Tax=Microbulbifer echini TaxID=1529067 RepID=A0ABV4NSV3_9GAMM
MDYRRQQIEELNLGERWLGAEHAQSAYDFALKYSATDRYGLNTDTVSSIDRLEIESASVAKNWLSDRLDSVGSVQVVLNENEVFVVQSDRFLESWQDIFMPARDDAMIIHNNSKIIVFYCHEDELEIGVRNT